jgi:hypothetical protein
MSKVYCRWAPSLGELEGTAEKVWGTLPYEPDLHSEKPCVFFGLYGLPDFYTLWRHKGKKWVFWAGSDINHFRNGYWLDSKGDIKVHRGAFARWINENCESWVENDLERKLLKSAGVDASICSSFMGDIEDFEVSYSKGNNAYLSCSGGLVKEYGFETVERIASELPWVNFHLYGAEWKTKNKNVIVHGRVPKEEMNNDIKNFQLALRFNETDGFSEILAKAVLMGQYAIGKVKHPFIPTFKNDLDLIVKINKLLKNNTANLRARSYYRENLNLFPWNVKKHTTA